jgi:hypothetical protein
VQHSSRPCQDCNQPFTPKTSQGKRCPDCAARRKATGGHKPRAQGGRPSTNARLAGLRWWGIDGEGVNRPGGRHEYVYLCAVAWPDGEVRELWRGGQRLQTEDILWWLWKLPGGDMFTWFSSSYDWEHIFADLSTEKLRQIYYPERAFDFVELPGGFRVSHLKNVVRLSRITVRASDQSGYDDNAKFFSDTWRSNPGPFVSFIDSWQTGTPEERAEIRRMKKLRADFTECGPDVRAYCQMECRHLAQGASLLWQALVAENIVPAARRTYSAGSYAKALFRSRHVADYRGPDRYAGAEPGVVQILQRAMFGARVELAEPGIHPVLDEWDLTSAYPANMVTLPCMAHGHWAHYPPGYKVPPGARSVYRVKWKQRGKIPGPAPQRWGPLPWRADDGSITFPLLGEGWYWDVEAQAAGLFGGFDVSIKDCWAWVPECAHQPFAWVPEVFARRAEVGKSTARGLALKITLNSCYGTTADTVSTTEDGGDPPFPSAIWSAITTAGTRAAVAQQLAVHGSQIVAIATDAFFTRPLIAPGYEETGLGAWERAHQYEDVLFVQAGMRKAASGDMKTRGTTYAEAFDQRIFERARSAWLESGWSAVVDYERHSLTTAKDALRSDDPRGHWGQWETRPRQLSFIRQTPSGWKGKRVPGEITDGIGQTRPVTGNPDRGLSRPYKKLTDRDTSDREALYNRP